MTKAVIYARFSSDLQRDRSIEDQVELCRSFAIRSGYDVVEVYSDRARSGASIIGRDGLLTLMETARTARFSVVIVEALDRLSRDQEDLSGIYKRLTFAGIEIRAVHDGKADQVQVGIRGLVGALYLQDLSHKVRRGMAGVTRDGRHAGGRAFGYRPVPGQAGELSIVDEEAAVVRRIFEAYVAGQTPRAIAAALNADRVPPPRGAYWAASALNGNKKRGHGILVNPLYAGTIVWNRVRMVKDPETGKRVSRVNDEAEWQRAPAPHLAIVSPELFAQAQALGDEKGKVHPSRARKPKHLLSGLLKCGCCGAGMSVKDRSAGRVRIHCTAAKEGGACSNTKAFYLDMIEAAVVGGLKARLSDRKAIAAYLKAYNDERKLLAADKIKRRSSTEARLQAVQRETDRTVTMMIKELIDDEVGATTLRTLKAEKLTLQAELATVGEAPTLIELHPTAIKDYLAAIDRLEETLRPDAEGNASLAVQPIRDLVDRVTLTPKADGTVAILVEGHLSKLIGGDHFPRMQAVGGKVVAEVRYRFTPQDVLLPFQMELIARKRA